MCIGPTVVGLQTGSEDLKTTRPSDWDALGLGPVQPTASASWLSAGAYTQRGPDFRPRGSKVHIPLM